MNRRRTTLGALAISSLIGSALLLGPSESAQAACQLHSPSGNIKHVVHLTFDNVHFRRDNPNIPSDLELQPNLLNFITGKGTLLSNHFTPLISHTSDDIITALTGVYGDRHGIPVGNSYGFFNADGSVSFSSSFLYWTALNAGGKVLEMINENGKTAPAPWVSFTRAGCDVGAYSVANIELESVPADVNTVFGPTSPEGIEANNSALRDKANADFLGIAVHCAQNSPLCTGANASQARPDLLPDEPGGYTGFNALFGNLHVQPVISPSGPIKDLDGNVIQTAAGNPGFPNTFSPTATQTLGYAAQMLEAGIPVVYIYIADIHDQNPPPGGSHTFGPGEAGFIAQAAAYNKAWGQFFARLKADGIDETNTLFVFTSDENDHFVGGQPSPANCDGINTPCTYTAVGEITTNLNRVLLTQRNNSTPFAVHSDDAPTFYLTGNPAPTAASVRTMEHDLDTLTATSLITGNTDKLSFRLADQAEMRLLHMITSDTARTPTFTMFGNPDYFFQTASPTVVCTANPNNCFTEQPTFAYNHGDVQQDIIRTWLGMVGPGVLNAGVDNSSFTDHTDIRPTMMALLGLTDDYVHDGRVLAEKLSVLAQPLGVQNSPMYVGLATAFKAINAAVGPLGLASLDYSNGAITSDDTTYANYLATMNSVTANRNSLTSQMKTLLNGASFSNQPISNAAAQALIQAANSLLAEVQSLARGSVSAVAAVAPSARATSVNGTVTGFAAMINASAATLASQCGIALPSGFPGVLQFQTTNPSTNLPTGTLNQPVDIAAGKTQTFVFAITPTAVISQDIPLVFSCGGGGNAVTTIHGVNTFLVTASATPLPDMVMIDATATNDGTLTLPTASNSGAIGSAAINIGAAGTVTFTPTVTPYGQPTQTLPLSLSICQTNTSGACINPTTPGPSATVNVAANQTVLLATFIQGQGAAIPFDPANNRIFAIGTSGGVAVGEASVAIKVQSNGSMAQNP